MDFLLVMLLVATMGGVKVILSKDKPEKVVSASSINIATDNSSATASLVEIASIPIGDNLSLIKDSEAFTLILKELGLRK